MLDKFKYIEIVQNGVTNRGRYVEKQDNWSLDYYGKGKIVDAFHSIFVQLPDIVSYTDGSGGKSGYTGDVCSDCLFWDIDSSDLDTALSDTRTLIDRLIGQYQVVKENLAIYYSGCKGFHVLLYCPELFRFQTEPNQHEIIRNICSFLAMDIPSFDDHIYDRTRIFRTPNSINGKTGLYKIPLSIDEVNTLGIKQLQDLAKDQRKIEFKPTQDVSVHLLNKIHSLLTTKVKSSDSKQKNFSQSQLLEGIKNGFPEGDRNNGLTSVAGLLRSRNFSPDLIYAFLSAINSSTKSPISDGEVETITNSVSKYSSNPLFVEPSASDIITMEGAAKKWYELRSRTGKLNSGFQHIDNLIPYFDPGEVLMVAARSGVGKSQPLYSKILTPNGWTTMRDIKSGDLVIGSNGKPTKVVGVYPQGILDVYQVRFNDKSTVNCSKDHLWFTRTARDRKNNWKGSVKTTEEIMNSMNTGLESHVNNHSIPYVKPVQFSRCCSLSNGLLWAIGLFIGDGCCVDSTPKITIAEDDLFDRFSYAMDCIGDKLVHINKFDYRIVGQNFKRIIKSLDIDNLRSYEKFIPVDVLHSEVSQRISILQGLIDSDGSIVKRNNGKGNTIEFSTTSSCMVHDMMELVRGLGGKLTFTSRMGRYKKDGVYKETRTNYRILITLTDVIPVTSHKHLDKYTPIRQRNEKYITSIVKLDPYECQCIKVEAEDSLYVTDGYNLTHNTTLGMQLSNGIARGYDGYGLFASLEMPTTSIFVRSAIMHHSKINKKQSTYEEVVKELTDDQTIAENVIESWKNLLIIDKSSLSTEQLSAYYEQAQAKFDFKINNFLIDYVGLIAGTDDYSGLSKVAREVKTMAKRLNTRVILVCQLSRTAKDGTIPVTIDMLRDSGALEESADYICGLWHSKTDDTRIHGSFIKNRFADRDCKFDMINTGLSYSTCDYKEDEFKAGVSW